MKRCGMYLLVLSIASGVYADSDCPFNFEMVSIDEDFPRGYQIKFADVNGDDLPDIIALREGETGVVAWYKNPTWTKHRLTPESISRPLSIAPKDIDGDGDMDLAVVYDFDFGDSVVKGAVCWLEQGDDPESIWTPHHIDSEPMQHRVLWLDFDGDGVEELVAAPLMGRNTKPPLYLQSPVRIKISEIPDDPKTTPWPTDILYDRLHVIHGLDRLEVKGSKADTLLTASHEGVSALRLRKGKTECTLLHKGNQIKEDAKGSSEVDVGILGKQTFYATIEPRHGNEVVVYTGDNLDEASGALRRFCIDDRIQVGHGLLCADFDRDGNSEILVGDRGKSKSYYLYYLKAREPMVWERMTLDDGGLAGAGCDAADIDGDGDLDIAAVGSSTGNVRLYMNRSVK